MALRGAFTLLSALMWITAFSSSRGINRFKPRIRVERENAEFLSFRTSNRRMVDNLKLIQDRHSENIYAGGPHGLFMFNPTKHSPLVPVFECLSNSANCGNNISLLKEGRNRHPLFICRTEGQDMQCCDVSSEHQLVNCSRLNNILTNISGPSLHVGDALYLTVSDWDKDREHPRGLYKWTNKFIWPQSRQTEQRHIKIIANQGKGPLDGKVYSFYIEQNQNQDPELPLWIPKVSQICMADLGGSKALLQFRWTSMLTARLFCGDEAIRTSYTELVDVAVLEAPEWENTAIYGLFKNAHNLRAVCVYRMSDIIGIYASNSFRSSAETFASPRPGECVPNSPSLPMNILKFMESLPEMMQWIKPVRDPLLFDPHHHYTHLQVDRVENRKSGLSHQVLFMSLDNGHVHKILEQDDEPFIIAVYEPFKTRTNIFSMLLDRRTKKLFVSSRSEVIRVDPYDCSVYGKHCDSCVMARDPYCGWDLLTCSPNDGSLIQDVAHGNQAICQNVPETGRDSPISVPRASRYYLRCPVESQHASYSWEHQGRWMECVPAKKDCLLLIDSMSEENQGVYRCVASENGYNKTLRRHELQLSTASRTKATVGAVTGLLVLISGICW